MSITGARPRSPLATLNPLVALLVVLIVAVAMIISLHPLSAGIVLAAESVLIVTAGLPMRQWLLRSIPLGLALTGIMIANLLFSDAGGELLIDVGVIRISSGSVAGAVAVALRLLALALPGIAVFAAIDPTELADALITHWHANPRIAVGSLAAVRMTPLVVDDLRQSYAARRTRGVISRNPFRAAITLFRMVASVLITTIRRATRLSVAMDARGFDAGLPRTTARISRWRLRDTGAIVACFTVCVIAVAAPRITG